MEGKRDKVEEAPQELVTFSAIARKHDKKILYVECGEDFVDLLFTFLAVPLESALEISGESFKELSGTQVSTSEAVIPHYYRCGKQLLNIITEQTPPLTRISDSEPVVLIDPKSNGNDQSTEDSGFAKGDTTFTVSDDLVITPMNSRSTFCLLKKLQTKAEDLEVQDQN